MKIKGIKRGQTIELLGQINYIPDGTEVSIELDVIEVSHPAKELLSDEERLARLNQLFGAWKDQPDLLENFAEIDQERHAYCGREIASLDAQDID
jgi:hypothetical protein